MSKKYFIWVSDCYSNTGEGRLAIKFIDKFVKLKNINPEIKTFNIKTTNYREFKKKNFQNSFRKSNFSFFFRYLIFLNGILLLWINYLKGKRVIYLNYLPLWNFLIFMLAPPSTIFGPITGSSQNISNIDSLNNFIRKYFFPLFFSISVLLLLLRNSKYIFSTSLLNNKTTEKIRSNSLFDIQLLFKKQKKLNINKKYDLIIYNRAHITKNELNFEKILKHIKNKKYKILVLGEKVYLKSVKNLGFISHNKVIQYLSKTKFTIIPSENIYSFYFLDSHSCNVKTLISKKTYYNRKILKIDNKALLDFQNINKVKNKLNNILKGKIKIQRIKINQKFLRELSISLDKLIIKSF